MSSDHRFRGRERLRLRNEFARVYAARCSRGDAALVVYVAPNGLGWSRLGLNVSRRIGGAVTRNYVKRRIREAFRLQKSELPVGFDVICVAKERAADRDWDILRSLRTLFRDAVDRAKRES